MTLAIVDMGILHRAWHRAESSGDPPLRIFADMLASLIASIQPSRLICALDSPKSWRKAQCNAWRADRPPTPPAFPAFAREAVALLHEEAGIVTASASGYEADDVAASIVATLPRGQGCLLVSVDSDWLSLVSPLVHCFDPSKLEYLDPAKVEARWGVTPAEIPQLWALIGTENLPGCKGIGESRGAALIRRFGSVEALYRWFDDCLEDDDSREIARLLSMPGIGGTCVQALLDGRADVLQCLDLATLRTDAPVRLEHPDLVDVAGLVEVRGSICLANWDQILDVETRSPIQIDPSEVIRRLHRAGPIPDWMAEGPRETDVDGEDGFAALDGDDGQPTPHAADHPTAGPLVPREEAVAQLEAMISRESAELVAWEEAVRQKRALIEAWRVALRGARGEEREAAGRG